MAAETNLIAKADIARVRMVDFNYQFVGNLRKFMELLGVTRKIPVVEGTTLKGLKVTGTLASGVVAEGDVIPLSKYSTTEVDIGTAILHKWRKATSAEAILKGGYEQAVGATTDKMVKDIQKSIRTNLIGSLEDGTGTATGVGMQAALANAWGKLQVLFEDDAVEAVYFLNPMDVSDYLGTAQVSLQTVFGMSYIENFLGLGTVILTSGVTAGTFYATAKENLVAYYINMNNGEIAQAFNLVADETGFVGINEYTNNERAQVEDLVMSGVDFFAERVDGIVVGEITEEASA